SSGGHTLARRTLVQIAAGPHGLPATSKPKPKPKVKQKPKAKPAAHAPSAKTTQAEKPVSVVVAATLDRRIQTRLGKTTRLVPARPEQTFALVSDPRRNVQVVVLDADRYGLRAVHDIRLVFPR